MKIIRQSLYYIILLVICLVGVALPAAGLDLNEGEKSERCDGCQVALSEKQEAAISDYCSEVKERLKKLQKDDARVRVNLGGRYETLLSKYILPLNVNLVENSASNADLVENQNTFAEAKKSFTTDYVEYQQKLEELITVDCKSEPKEFYEKLEKVRQERKTVEKDVKKIRNSITKHLKLVKDLKGKIKK